MPDRVAITTSLLDALADSISAKSGEPTPLTLAQMTDAVDGISTSGVDTSHDTVDAAHLLLGYTAHDSSGDAITGEYVAPSTTLQSKSKSYTPSETAQSETVSADVGYDGLSSVDVSVGAISSSYVGSGITRRDDSDLYMDSDPICVLAPAGYYESEAEYDLTIGSATPAASISGTGATASHSGTTLTLSKTVSNTPQVSAGYVSSGTAGNSSVSLSATDANFAAGNIKSGVSIFGLTGSYSGGGGSSNWTLLGSKDCGTVSTSSTTAATINKDFTVSDVGGYDLLVVETSVNTKVNGRHAATAKLIWLTASSAIGTKNGTAIATATWNVKLSSSGTATSRSNTTANGVYPNSCTLSTSGGVTSAAIVMYAKYSSTQTGTINGAYTARVYGCKLYDLIGG